MKHPIAIGLLFAALLSAGPLFASQFIAAPIDRVVADSADCVCGTVKSKEAKTNPNAFGAKVTYTFEVTDVMKGDHKAGDVITFTHGEGYKGSPSMMKDRQYCIFLTGESVKGFRGMINGPYRIDKRADGTKVLKGMVGRQDLLKDVASRNKSLSKSQRDFANSQDRVMPYDEMVNLVRTIDAEQRAERAKEEQNKR